MSTEPADIVRDFMASMAKLDYETGMTFVSDDCEYLKVPMGAVYGPAGIRSVLEPFLAPTLENEWIIKTVVSEGSTVVMERLDRHRLAKGWAELPVTGIFDVNNGKITSWRDYFDYATIERAFAENS